jgi:hypothetical protein
MLPFTVLDAAGRIVGMTTYMNVDGGAPARRDRQHLVRRQPQRSALNTSAS